MPAGESPQACSLQPTASLPGRFPEPGDEELVAGPSRNFQGFDPLDFLAEVTQHVPNAGEHLIRYYGWYSNKSRGHRAKSLPPVAAETGLPGRPPTAREARKGWTALVKQVYEADPLSCPRCGSKMKIIAFIERHQTEVIRRRSELWRDRSRRFSDTGLCLPAEASAQAGEERGPPPAPKPAVS